MSNEERRIVQEKNVTAIVHHSDPALVQNWDASVKRDMVVHKATVRTAAIGLALSTLNGDPTVSNYYVERDPEGNKPEMDYYGEKVLPLADRIYDYITQDN